MEERVNLSSANAFNLLFGKELIKEALTEFFLSTKAKPL